MICYHKLRKLSRFFVKKNTDTPSSMCLYSHRRSLFKAAFKYNLFIQQCNLAFSKQCVDIQVFVQN